MNRLNNILLILISVSFCTLAYPQNIKFGIQTGIGTYSMKGLKDLNSTVFKTLPFQAKITSNFPPYFYYKPVFLFSFNKFNIGFQGAYYSTGSRISSKDYSGEYAFDTKIHCLVPSAYIDLYLFSLFVKCKVSIFSEGGITFSKLSLKETLTVNNQDITNSSYSFKSKNYYVQSGLKFDYKIYRYISLELNTSYFAQFGKKVFESDKNELLNDGKKSIGPDWSGLRFGLSILVTRPIRN